MKSVELTGIRKMELREARDPQICKPDDVLLKVESIGVCGSDVHYYSRGRIGSQIVQYPFRVGHECSATVLETGGGVRNLKKNDLVAVDPASACGTCDQCLAGRANTCRNLTFLGTPGQGDGCFCEYIIMPQQSLFSVPESITPDEAALVEPLSIGVYAAGLASPLKAARVGILGCGPIGMSVMHAAIDQKVEKTYVTDKIDSRLQAAKEAGADWIGNPNARDIVSEITATEPLLLDVVFECCGQQEALDQAVDLLKPGGRLVIVGIPEEQRISFNIDSIRRKELLLQNVRRQNDCMQRAIGLLKKRHKLIQNIITHHFKLEETQKAFDLVESYTDQVLKAMIHANGR